MGGVEVALLSAHVLKAGRAHTSHAQWENPQVLGQKGEGQGWALRVDRTGSGWCCDCAHPRAGHKRRCPGKGTLQLGKGRPSACPALYRPCGQAAPEGRLEGNLTLLTVPPAQGRGTGRGLGLSTDQGYQDCDNSGQMAQEYGAASGLSISRGASGPCGPTPWLRSVPRSYDQHP